MKASTNDEENREETYNAAAEQIFKNVEIYTTERQNEANTKEFKDLENPAPLHTGMLKYISINDSNAYMHTQ